MHYAILLELGEAPGRPSGAGGHGGGPVRRTGRAGDQATPPCHLRQRHPYVADVGHTLRRLFGHAAVNMCLTTFLHSIILGIQLVRYIL